MSEHIETSSKYSEYDWCSAVMLVQGKNEPKNCVYNISFYARSTNWVKQLNSIYATIQFRRREFVTPLENFNKSEIN